MTEILLSPDVAVFVAEYLGFHNVAYKVLFETLLQIPTKYLKRFNAYMKDVAVEPFSVILPLLGTFFSKRKSRSSSLDINLREEEEDTETLLLSQRFCAKLLKWSLIYKNLNLYKSIWVLIHIDWELFNTSFVWISRFEACIELCDLVLFRTHYKEFQRYPFLETFEKEIILKSLVVKSFRFLEKNHERKQMFCKLYEENLLPVTKEMCLWAFYSKETNLYNLLLKNLHRISQDNDEADYKKQRRHEFRSFITDWDELLGLLNQGDADTASKKLTQYLSLQSIEDRRRTNLTRAAASGRRRRYSPPTPEMDSPVYYGTED